MEITKKVIDDIRAINFLSHDGKDIVKRCRRIERLDEALESINSLKWETITLEESGDLTAYLAVNEKELYNANWNKLVVKIKDVVIPTIDRKIDELVQAGRLLEDMRAQIRYDIITIIMAKTFAEYFVSDFFNLLGDVYTAGYIPCGWKGRYPKGKLLIL